MTPVRSELEVLQSQLPLVRVNAVEYEFQLKNRENLTVEIRPSPTLPLRNISKNALEIKNASEESELQEVPVPFIASMYYYDKKVVDVFKAFLANLRESSKISSQHRDLIQK